MAYNINFEAIDRRDGRRMKYFTVPIAVQVPGNGNKTFSRDLFIDYYKHEFQQDLCRFYDMSGHFGDKSYPFVPFMACHGRDNSARRSMTWSGTSHFYMFSASVFYMSLCTQVVGRLYDWEQMRNLLRASGWPLMFCGLGGLMHPIQMILESELYPMFPFDSYLDVLDTVGKYLIDDFLAFFNGHSANLNDVAYQKLCKVANIKNMRKEIMKQVEVYKCWICDPDTPYESMYVPFPVIDNEKMQMHKYLNKYKEEVPDWLKHYHKGDELSFDAVMGGRVGYYPGSGFDGNLVKVANKAHCVHSFLYVDYLVKKEQLTSKLDSNSFLGYHSIGRIEWTEKDIMPNGQFPILVNYTPKRAPMNDKTVAPYCFTEILERNPDKGSEWGAERFAVTFLFADGIATYYQLFVRQYKKAPWIFLLQDHGFGCNYDCFGKYGYLDAIISQSGIQPEFVICAANTRIWNGYRELWNVGETKGGMHNHERSLFQSI